MLNRVISYEEDGIAYQANIRHGELIVKAMQVAEMTGAVTPSVVEEEVRQEDEEQEVDEKDDGREE